MTKQKLMKQMEELAFMLDTKEGWEIINTTTGKTLKNDFYKRRNTLTNMYLVKRGIIEG